MAKLDLTELEKRLASGLLRRQMHPTLPLYVWNYTEKVQFENLWDEYTLQCRGLITDFAGNVIARPFKKFFNLNTTSRPETMIENIPAEVPEITEEFDGSMITVSFYLDEMVVASRGSFTSEQSQWAREWIDINRKFTNADVSKTYICEAIYPPNRIVVDYAEREGLVLLAVIDNETGEEGDVATTGLSLGLTYAAPMTASLETVQKWLETLGPNEEGFVVHYPSTGLRIKMKGAEYVRLHRLVTQCTARRLWECLSSGQDLTTFLERVPDEFYQWVKTTEKDLLSRFNGVKVAAALGKFGAWGLADETGFTTRKEQAEYIFKNHKDVAPLVFALLDGKNIDEMAWKRVKPEHEVPFKPQI